MRATNINNSLTSQNVSSISLHPGSSIINHNDDVTADNLNPKFRSVLQIANQTNYDIFKNTKNITQNSANNYYQNSSRRSNYISRGTNSTLLYEVFLTYMYEGDLNEEQYWEVLIATSTTEGIRKYATKVCLLSEIDKAVLQSHPGQSVELTGSFQDI